MNCSFDSQCWGELQCLPDITYDISTNIKICTVYPKGFILGYTLTGAILGAIILIGLSVGLGYNFLYSSKHKEDEKAGDNGI